MKTKSKIMCELCGKEPADSFCALRSETKAKFEWKLAGDCALGREVYFIMFRWFFRSEESMMSWLRQLNGKSWIDWKSFMDALERYMESKE